MPNARRRGVMDAAEPHLGWVDMALLCLYLLGLYTHYTFNVAAHVPFPSAAAGIAGMVMLVRRRDDIAPAAWMTLLGVVLLYLVSILCATDLSFLGRRLNGFIQLVYSLVIGYAAFLTLVHAGRRQIAGMFLAFSLVIVVGCLLEDYAGLGPISDWVRERLYSQGIYNADLRDKILYGVVRPKFFASEPASVTFAFSLFLFIWLVVSRWRWKLIAYVALVGVAIFAIPGPTLLLMLLLVLPYELFLVGRRFDGRVEPADLLRFVKFGVLGVLLVAAVVVMSNTIFAARLKDIMEGNDASFFYRVLGPALAARDIMAHYPIAGAGLTGEPFVANRIVNVYVQSPAYSVAWTLVSPSTELLINYFWLHWIYLGIVWGSIMVAAVTVWLKVLGVPSPTFCWLVWAILGQASGAYVGPLAWSVLYFAGAAAVLHRRSGSGVVMHRARSAGHALWRPAAPLSAARVRGAVMR
ncbi:MAG TPA: hypothetical protein VMU87_14725 [Stellaceae bacterium]|nr:hypothetical protein [Stellaceae bacterium]